MKKHLLAFLFIVAGFALPAQEKTLLWRISGNGLAQPSYLFGTMHMLCADDIVLSDSLQSAISRADKVYLELEMDNMMEMFGAMMHMGMKGDTTLADLLSEAEYKAVKNYFEEHRSMLPFSMLETFKPMLTAALLAEQQAGACDNVISMEQLIMQAAKARGKKIHGLETMNYQLSLFDKIPYRLQARELFKAIQRMGNSNDVDILKLTSVYRDQDLEKMEALTLSEEMGMSAFTDLLLYDRNRDWVNKFKASMTEGVQVFAVGAGHLPGKEGVINLLRKAGYKVEPVQNVMTRKVLRDS